MIRALAGLLFAMVALPAFAQGPVFARSGRRRPWHRLADQDISPQGTTGFDTLTPLLRRVGGRSTPTPAGIAPAGDLPAQVLLGSDRLGPRR